MDIALYREVIDRIRSRNAELIINLTTGPGGRFVPGQTDPRVAGPGTTLLPPEKRVEHIEQLKPDICTLDLNTMNSGAEVVINTPRNVTRMARIIRAAGVKAEIELLRTCSMLSRRQRSAWSICSCGLRRSVPSVRWPSRWGAMASDRLRRYSS